MRTIIFAALPALGLAACSQGGQNSQTAQANQSAPVNQAAPAKAEPSNQAGGDMTPTSIDVIEAASANDNLSTFLQAAVSAGLGETLANQQGITIFAPINEAFESVDGLAQIQQNPERLANLLKRHAVATRYLSRDIPQGTTRVQTLSGETLTITNNNGSVEVTTPAGTRAMVVEADITGENGVVHAINKVLVD